MTVRNAQKQALKASLNTDQLGKAMAQLDLSDIPEHKRKQAIKDHLMRVAADTIHDRNMALELHAARLMHLKANQ